MMQKKTCSFDCLLGLENRAWCHSKKPKPVQFWRHPQKCSNL